MNVHFINLSDIVGGQELYLANVFSRLPRTMTPRLYCGDAFARHPLVRGLPEGTVVSLPSIAYSAFPSIMRTINSAIAPDDVMVCNGNRAIYLGSLMARHCARIAIQHSALVDNQVNAFRSRCRIICYRSVVTRRFDAIVAVSEHSIRPLHRHPLVRVILNGIDNRRYKPAAPGKRESLRRRYGFGARDVVLLMVGRLNENKGQYRALEVLRHLDNRYRLLLVGEGPDMAAIASAAQEEDLRGRIILTGPLDDPGTCYQLADLLLFLSAQEGLPLVILEAMACGLPLATTPVGAVPEILRPGEHCLFISREDPEGAAGKIDAYLRDRKNLRQSVRRNRSLIDDRLNLNRAVGDLAALIMEKGGPT